MEEQIKKIYEKQKNGRIRICLLYTSDAADDRIRV